MYIGIDLGTSGVKAILVNSKGEIINEATKSYSLNVLKPLWREQNPEDWYNATIEVLLKVVKGNEDNIKALSFSGQMHGLVILDKNDDVIRPAILWNDQRADKEVEYLNNTIGKEKLIEETGNIAFAGFTLPKLMWVRENEPENFKKINKIMLPKDYLIYRFTNEFVSDVSDLSGTLYFDVKKRTYSDYILNMSGIDINQLPKILESSEVVGYLSQQIAESLKLSKQVKVIVGGGDQAVGAIGTGIVNNGDVNVSLGTSGVVFVSSDKFFADDKTYLHSFAHANNKYHLMGVTLAAAGSLDWWKNNFYPNNNFEDIVNEAANTKIDDTVYYLPYLSGERSPINDSYAKGTFVGFSLEHSSANFSRAILEGVTYSLKQSFDAIADLGFRVDRIRLTGGGAKNDFWCQMISDVFKVVVETIEAQEGPAFGAAILAMVGNDEYETVEEACQKLIKTEKFFNPNDENSVIYSKKYKNYVKLYQRLKTFFKEI